MHPAPLDCGTTTSLFIASVTNTHTDLTILEEQCIQLVARPVQQSDQYWRGMIAIHRALLRRHLEFFALSQHPLASPDFRHLPVTLNMPVRMWKHGMHSLLELLRRSLPGARKHMDSFLLHAYQTLIQVYDNVKFLRRTWVERLGYACMYLMIDKETNESEMWASIGRSWYEHAIDANPAIGRLYGHLALLNKKNLIRQLSLYTRLLTCIVAFPSPQQAFRTIFHTPLNNPSNATTDDICLLQIHATLSYSIDNSPSHTGTVQTSLSRYIDNLDAAITEGQWNDRAGADVAFANIGAILARKKEAQTPVRFLFVYRFSKMIRQNQESFLAPPGVSPEAFAVPDPCLPPAPGPEYQVSFKTAIDLLSGTLQCALKRVEDESVCPHVHIVLVFLWALTQILKDHKELLHCSGNATTISLVLDKMPWPELVSFLNFQSQVFCAAEKKGEISREECHRPLPEDWDLRGLLWSFGYVQKAWFSSGTAHQERYVEVTSSRITRSWRMMGLGSAISKVTSLMIASQTSHS